MDSDWNSTPNAERTRPLPVAPTDFLIGRVAENCKECWGCVRYCPAKAIRVLGGRSEIIVEKCVKCGLCVTECANGGHAVRDDTQRVRDLLASGRPVVAVLALEFIAALHPMTPPEVERSLESVGFYAVESTLLGEEMVAASYEQAHARDSQLPRLRSTCPVATSWVQRFYPELTPALVPTVPPYIAQARLVRELYSEEVAIVYVSPCYARKDEIFEPAFLGEVDAAIDFLELEQLMAGLKPRPPLSSAPASGSRRPQIIKEISLTDGFPRRTLEDRNMTTRDVLPVRGLRALDRLLSAIVRGEAAPSVVDMLNCEGCIDGPAVNPGMSVFAKRNVIAAEREAQSSTMVSSRALLSYMPSLDLVRSFDPMPVVARVYSAEDIDATLADGEFHSRETTPDCGACGYRTCVEHAAVILGGDSTWDMCFPLQRKKLKRDAETLEARATLDALTGLWNRRVFSERLIDEVARSRRYGTPVSLIMLDLDGFKQVNDGHGHVTGDRVLAEVSSALRESLRETDVPCRYGGDEFAVILPGTHKTEAFVVAEKLRDVLRARRIQVGNDHDAEVGMVASFGVACVSERVADDIALLEAADSALYSAKESGRDQVRLAAG